MYKMLQLRASELSWRSAAVVLWNQPGVLKICERCSPCSKTLLVCCIGSCSSTGSCCAANAHWQPLLTQPAAALSHAPLQGNAIVVGRKSPFSLYDPVIASFEDDKGLYNQADAGGFIKLQALRLRTLGVNRHKMV
jgi:hypothetical protein